jgi:hypothetical protein
MKTEAPLLLNIQITVSEATSVLMALGLSAQRSPALAADYLLAARSIEIELETNYGIPAAKIINDLYPAPQLAKEAR